MSIIFVNAQSKCMANKVKVDINADLGEGLNNEARLMPFLSSCNIACGGHAGDKQTMLSSILLAKKHQVKIGAHPSFPDRENFGRKPMEISEKDLKNSLINQIKTFISIATSENTKLHHIKTHGALYNLAAKNEKVARIIANAVNYFDLQLKLYAPYESVMARVASEHNIEVIFEAFADRNYNDDLSLVARSNSNAIIVDPKSVFEHVKLIVLNHKVRTLGGVEKRLKAETFCVHGDHANAEQILRFLNAQLQLENIKIG